MKIIELIKEDLTLSVIKFILKKIFLNKRAKACYKNVWKLAKITTVIFTIMITLFFVFRSKAANSFKLGLALVLMLGVSLMIYQSIKKPVVVKS